MSVPVGSAYEVKLGARTSVISLIYGFIQTFYILMRPSFSAPCPGNVRLLKTGGYALSALGSAVNLILSVTVYRSSESEDIVQASSAALALFHGGLYWAYTRMTTVFLPFFFKENSSRLRLQSI